MGPSATRTHRRQRRPLTEAPPGGWLTVLSLTSLPSMPTSDRHWFLAGGRPALALRLEASSLWTGDHSALKDLSVPLGLLGRAGRPVFFCPSKSAPAFLFVP